MSNPMSYLLALVLSFVPLILKKVLALLGIGLVTFVGADLLMSQASDLIMSSYNNLGTDILALLDLAGFDTALKMLMATWAGLIALASVQKSASIVMGVKS